MGIRKQDLAPLFYAKTLGVSFSETLTLGRQQLFATKADIASAISKYGTQAKGIDEVAFRDEYSEPLFEILGANRVESVDYSDYEKATVIHDLNKPLPESLRQSFSAVVDGGTLEHVFNFPEAIRNCMLALKTGGHFLGFTPANNQMGHGFYQFSPDLYYRVFSPENGFRVKRMLLNVEAGPGQPSWYEVADPKVVHHRVALVNNLPLFIVLIAEKTEDLPIFTTTPQQSDYLEVWHAATPEANATTGAKALNAYRKWMPKRAKIVLHNIYDLLTKEKVSAPGLGEFEAGHFAPVDL